MAIKNEFFTTKKGEAVYPHLSRPDTKFDKDGHYKVNLKMSKEDAQPVIDLINDLHNRNVEELSKTKKNVKIAPMPYFDEEDDDGNPTGKVIIKFKSKAAYKPAIYDAGKPPKLIKESDIWGGSELRVGGTAVPFHTAAIGAGITIRIRAVQVIKYVEGGGGGDKYGFSAEDGGFVGEKLETPKSDEPTVYSDKKSSTPPQSTDAIMEDWAKE
tara:strand:+ start:5133 stop:5771 length:639 start_codon:yes stop_codon:yes gene_type:complete